MSKNKNETPMFGMDGMVKDSEGYLINPTGQVFGYARVSTKQQSELRQLDAMKYYGVRPNHIFMEKVSGKDFNRPIYKRMLRLLRRGDVLVINSLDRLGRSYTDIIDQWKIITRDIGCGIHVIDMPVLSIAGDPDNITTKLVTDMILSILSFVAETERKNTLARQRAGLDAKMMRNATCSYSNGRPPVKFDARFWDLYLLWRSKTMTSKEIHKICEKEFHMSERTMFRRLAELDGRYGDIPTEKLRDYIMEDYDITGFDWDEARVEHAIGVYGKFDHDPRIAREYARKRAEKRSKGEDLDEERSKVEADEIRQIISEKRQEEFRRKFNISEDMLMAPKKEKTVHIDKDGKIHRTKYWGAMTVSQKEALKRAKEAEDKPYRTLIID